MWSFARQWFVTCLPLWSVFVPLALWAGPPDVDRLVHSVEARYNHAESLKLDFSESYIAGHRPAQNEAGVLFLRKPGKMRWEYREPAGKVFLSDGKDVYLYLPDERKAERSKLKASDDMRAPLAFLLGKLDFAKEFRTLRIEAEGSGTWIAAEPKSKNLAYSKVEFEALPSGEIRRVRVTGQDQSKLEFAFSNEQLNAPVQPALFIFHAPAGVQVIEANN